MAHFAKLDNENIVEQVIVVANDVLLDESGIEQEKIGIDFCRYLSNWNNWKQTSYNKTFRKNFAGIGYFYDENRDAFIPPKPFNSWVLDEETCIWNPPVKYPENTSEDDFYTWDEEIINWKLIKQ
jgi:hypothetical protein